MRYSKKNQEIFLNRVFGKEIIEYLFPNKAMAFRTAQKMFGDEFISKTIKECKNEDKNIC